jgi:membrane protease subunit (stomatin/prohibitin family)
MRSPPPKCRCSTLPRATPNWARRCCRSSIPITTAKYGIEIASFILENASVPPEVEAAIDKRSSMSAIGNLNDYVKFQMAEGMAKGGGADVLATLEKGELKGKKIGSTWRVTRAALDEFLKS